RKSRLSILMFASLQRVCTRVVARALLPATSRLPWNAWWGGPPGRAGPLGPARRSFAAAQAGQGGRLRPRGAAPPGFSCSVVRPGRFDAWLMRNPTLNSLRSSPVAAVLAAKQPGSLRIAGGPFRAAVELQRTAGARHDIPQMGVKC